MNRADIKPGAWLKVRIKSPPFPHYVVRVHGEDAMIGSPHFLAWETMTVDLTFLETEGEFIGMSKRRWWWCFLPWRKWVCPFTIPTGALDRRKAR